MSGAEESGIPNALIHPFGANLASFSTIEIMTHRIVRRHFAKVNEKWGEVEDLQQRGIAFDRTWSSFCVFFASSDTARLKDLAEREKKGKIELVPSPSGDGAWVMGAYYQLEMLLTAENA